jgi:hypothetical protein
MAMVTETGIFQRSSVFLAALYKDLFSLKILHTSTVFEGGLDVAHAVIRNRNKKKLI